MTQQAQPQSLSLDSAIFSNIANKQGLTTPHSRINFLTPGMDDKLLTRKEAAGYVGISTRTLERHRDNYKFPNPIPGQRKYLKRHLDFYKTHGPDAWYEVISKHTAKDLAALNDCPELQHASNS